jgi:nitroreductase
MTALLLGQVEVTRMDVKDAIDKRRAYRSLEHVEISEELVKDLAETASLSPSCFNYQPWRYVFVTDRDMLLKMQDVMSKGNEWTALGSMIIAVFSKPEFDCRIKEREYNLFDTGMATAFMILRATELGLVAHPIAGFSPKKAKTMLGIPDDMTLLTLIIVGKKKEDMDPLLSDKQMEIEDKRPERKAFEEFAFIDKFSE